MSLIDKIAQRAVEGRPALKFFTVKVAKQIAAAARATSQ